jgi:ribose transport system ATP-binding protein
MSDSTTLVMMDVSKAFQGVQALDKVSFDCIKGEVHALVGENGAGKSTLMKILSGAYQPDSGTIELNGKEVEINDPRRAQDLGISIIYQEFNLIPYLDIAQNIFLGREPVNRIGMIDYKTMYADAEELMSQIGANFDLKRWVGGFSVAEMQMIEIVKALSLKARIVIMDEPSSALSEEETNRLFEIIRSLKEQGISIIYITHRIKEVFEVAERATVLKDGAVAGTESIEDIDENSLVRLMIGRSLDAMYPEKGEGDNEPILSVRGLSRKGAFENISFDLHKKEILGFAGLVGAGRTAVARAVFGADPVDEGQFFFNGEPAKIKSPRDASSLGIGLVPEDRRNHGLVLALSVRSNIVLPILAKIKRFLFTSIANEKKISKIQISSLDIKTPSSEHEVGYLSGGNQQKVVLSKWIVASPKVIIFDEPTRGIDVGAKAEIHRLMRELADNGTAILMISSELPEILGMSDRIMVMNTGQVSAIFSADEATEEKVMAAATGVKESQAVIH